MTVRAASGGNPACESFCEAIWWGRIGYDDGLSRMERRAAARREQRVPDALILLEHEPVVTLGRNARAGNLLASPEEIEKAGIAVRECGRGGDVTYHGPGQLVGYPVMELEPRRRDVHGYLRGIEEALIHALSDLGVDSGRKEGCTGVWASGEKVASIGVRLSRWVTSHGFALNVLDNLSGFDLIVPCGLQGCRMTSVERLLGRSIPLSLAAEAVALRFGEVFGRRIVWPVGERAGSVWIA